MATREAITTALQSVIDRMTDPTWIPPESIRIPGHQKPKLVWSLSGTDTTEAEAAGKIRRQIGGKWDKDMGTDLVYLRHEDDVARYVIIMWRTSVCRKVVTGTKVETVKVQDPAALAAVPMVEVTRDVEMFEWQCDPILSD